MKALVIIPTYNERENISNLAEAVLKKDPRLNILVVDDNSPDKTYEIVMALSKKYSNKIFLIKRSGKLGLGTAYIEGFKWAIAHKYEYVLQMDADFSHSPDYIPLMLDKIKKCDLVIGSRYVKDGGTKNWGTIRKIISRAGSIYARSLLNLKIRDLTGGFKCFRRKVLENIDLNSIKSNGYCFQIETTYRSILKGFKVTEIPIIFDDRRVGKSKMSKKIVLEALIKVPSMRSIRHKLK